MKKIILFGMLLAFLSPVDAQLNTVFKSVTDYSASLNDVWGYVGGGKEYALVGTFNSTKIIDVTNASNPIEKGSAPGPNSIWRDIKTYAGYAYVTNDITGGLQIINLNNLPNNITSSDWSFMTNIPGLGNLSNCHNIYIDDSGYGYLTGCNLNGGGVIYLDLFTIPGTPAYIGKGPSIYSHDVFVETNKMYTSDIYAGKMRIYTLSGDRTSTTFTGEINTPTNFTHNVWTNAAGTFAFTTDEKSNASTAAYDVSDPFNPVLLDEFRPLATIGTGVTPHNVHVNGDFLVISHYSDGVVIVDASDPSNMIEVGNYDTSSSGSGCWGAYPFLPSGNILASDIGTGLFVIEPTYVAAARLHGMVTDGSTGFPLPGVDVSIGAAQANQGSSTFTGYKTGIATAGTYNVTYSKAGYTSQTISVTISNGTTTIQNVALLEASLPIELINFNAQRINDTDVQVAWEAASNDPIAEFEVQRSIDGINYSILETITDRKTSGFAKRYEYIDTRIPSGTIYYRLKTIDPAGEMNYSPVKTITNRVKNEITLFPNPLPKGTILQFTVSEHLKNEFINISYYNAVGKLVDQQLLHGDMVSGQKSSAVLSPGLYIVRISVAGSIIKTERLVIR